MEADGEPTYDGGVMAYYKSGDIIECATHFRDQLEKLGENGQTFLVTRVQLSEGIPEWWGDREIADVDHDGI